MKPSMHISIWNKTVTIGEDELNLSLYSPIEFADLIIYIYEQLWTADECNETRRDLIKLHTAIMEA